MISLAAFDAFCQALPGAGFVVQWGDSHVHKVGPRLFAIGNLPDAGFVFKATPVGFAILMEQGLAVRAPYLRRGHWVAVAPDALKQAELFSYLQESHGLAVAALTRAQRRELGWHLSKVEIRTARPGEGQALFDVTWAATQARAAGFYTAAQIANWMGARDAAFYEASIAGGRVRVAVGAAVLGFVDTAPGELLRLYVRPEAMGQGIGRRLLALGVAEAAQNGEVRLEATLHAEGFYVRHGFVALERVIYPNELGGLPLEVVKMVFSG